MRLRLGRSAGDRGARSLLVGLAIGVSLTAAAVVASRGFASPNQDAANAAPPSPSLITAPVTEGVLSAQVALRADVAEVHPIPVAVPDDLGSALPVVTSLAIRSGQYVVNGQELLTVAERPVFVFSGQIPAFRDITPGTRGVDVSELQQGLRAAGYPVLGDQLGIYGPGTEAAIQSLYGAAGAQVAWTSPTAQQTLSQDSAAVEAAGQALAAAQRQLADDQAASSATAQARIPGDTQAVRMSEQQLASAQDSLAAARATSGVLVPRGEIVFVPALPARVVSLSVDLGVTASQSVPLAQVGSGNVMLTGTVGQAGKGQLRPGMTATASSDLTGASVTVRVASVSDAPSQTASAASGPVYPVTFIPAGTVPDGMIGQNVAVTVITATSATRQLIVPVAAIATNAAGNTFVTVVKADGGERVVVVRLGLAANGQQVIFPAGVDLKAGERVLIGMSTGTGQG